MTLVTRKTRATRMTRVTRKTRTVRNTQVTRKTRAARETRALGKLGLFGKTREYKIAIILTASSYRYWRRPSRERPARLGRASTRVARRAAGYILCTMEEKTIYRKSKLSVVIKNYLKINKRKSGTESPAAAH